MNHWTKLSIEFANQRNYLDELFSVYPTIPEGIRDVDKNLWQQVEQSFRTRNNVEMLNILLKMDLFPIKDSYTAYLKRDSSSISRNPNTVDRLCGRLYEMGLEKIFERCSEPKETNRQIGPLFKRWLNKGTLGITLSYTLKIYLLKQQCNIRRKRCENDGFCQASFRIQTR